MAELAARLRAAHRSGPSPVSSIFKAGELTVDLSSRTVRVSNRQVKLTATEFSLLTLFVRNAGKVLTHAQILREIWGPRMVKRLEYLRVYLKSLRAKIEMNPDAPQLLLTERLIGYQLKLPDC
jgi:two-component system KDP operon response regulator KdpE